MSILTVLLLYDEHLDFGSFSGGKFSAGWHYKCAGVRIRGGVRWCRSGSGEILGQILLYTPSDEEIEAIAREGARAVSRLHFSTL